MALFAKSGSGGGDFKPVSAGMHGAVLRGIADIGLQPSQNPAYKAAEKLILFFQLPGELRDDGTPQELPFTVTNSMHEKAKLRLLIQNWFSKPFPSDEAASKFDLESLVGRPCLLNVTHTTKGDKTYANVGGVNPLMPGMPKPEIVGEKFVFHSGLAADAYQRVYNALPEWVKKKVDSQIQGESKATAGTIGGGAGASEDDIPF